MCIVHRKHAQENLFQKVAVFLEKAFWVERSIWNTKETSRIRVRADWSISIYRLSQHATEERIYLVIGQRTGRSRFMLFPRAIAKRIKIASGAIRTYLSVTIFQSLNCHATTHLSRERPELVTLFQSCISKS